jgi:hypothetical protein
MFEITFEGFKSAFNIQKVRLKKKKYIYFFFININTCLIVLSSCPYNLQRSNINQIKKQLRESLRESVREGERERGRDQRSLVRCIGEEKNNSKKSKKFFFFGGAMLGIFSRGHAGMLI